MRFLILIGAEDVAGADASALASYHDELVCAGVLLAGDLTAGFWLVEVDFREEAVEWGRRVPSPGGNVESREVSLMR